MAGSAAPTRPHPQASPRRRVKGQRRWWVLVAAVAAAVLAGYGVFASLLAVTGQAGTGLQAGTDAGAQVTVGCQQAPVSVRPTYDQSFSASSGFDVPLTGFEISGVQTSCVTADSAWVLAVQLGGSFQELPEVLVLKNATPVRDGVYAVGPGPITAVASMGITGYSVRAATAETPGAPTVSVAPGDQSAVVTYAAPAQQGSSAVSAYQYSLDGGTTWAAVGSASPWTLTGLDNGTTYQLQLRAVNAVGPGSATAAVSVTPRTTPDAPTAVTVTAGDTQLSVAFTAPASNGGAAITNYQYTLDGGTTWTTRTPASTVSPLTITGLTNGTTYQVAIRAVNAAGAGTASATATIAPFVAVSATAWGVNSFGRLGDGSTTGRTSPVAVTATGALKDKTLTQVAGGGSHSCALDSAGKAYCWGWNVNGQLGDGSTTDRSTPVAVDTAGALSGKTLTQISSGGIHTCALDTAGKAYCWGYGEVGQIGSGNWTITNATPVAVTGALSGKTLTQISAGALHTCALDTAGVVYCWGQNFGGQLGTGDRTYRNVPVAVTSTAAYAQISAGEGHTCAITTTGGGHCWGDNSNGQLGDGSTTRRLTPVEVNGGHTFTHISSGIWHTCTRTTTGDIRCWGRNSDGQLGDGTTTASLTPTLVAGLTGKTITTVDAGGYHSCVLDTTRVAYCWGANSNGQLGDGTTTGRLTPTAVTGRTFTALSAADYHTLALAIDAS